MIVSTDTQERHLLDPANTVITRAEYDGIRRENDTLRKELASLIALTADLTNRVIALASHTDAGDLRTLSALRAVAGQIGIDVNVSA